MLDTLERTWKAETVEGSISGTSYKDIVSSVKQLAHAEHDELKVTISYLDSENEWISVDTLALNAEGEVVTVSNSRLG